MTGVRDTHRAMARFMLLMHDDTTEPERGEAWGPYLGQLHAQGVFEGGSSIAAGSVHRKHGTPARSADHVVGYVIVTADDIDAIGPLLTGNPVYEAGGTVEVRELIED